MRTPFWRATAAILWKDVRAELRGRELVAGMGLFSLISILVFSFALELDRVARLESIAGVLWVTVAFASVIGLNRSMAQERDGGNLEALLLAPVDRGALFAGKFIGNCAFTLIIALLLLPLMSVLYTADLIKPWVLLIIVLGTIGFTAVGTLMAAMSVQTRTREALLPILMLPIVLPVLLASVRASVGALNDIPGADWRDWVVILAVLDVIYLTLCLLLFQFVVEE